VLVSCAFLALAALGGSSPGSTGSLGLIVEEVDKASTGERAGLRAGDVLVSWSRASPPGRGELLTPFDLVVVETSEGPRGALTLRGSRGSRAISVSMPVGEWGLKTRPRLSEGSLQAYERARGEASAGHGATLLSAAADLAATLERDGAGRDVPWLWLRLGEIALKAGTKAEAITAFDDALAAARRLADARAESIVLDAEGVAFQSHGELARAEDAGRAACELRTRDSGEGLWTAMALEHWGRSAWLGLKLDLADERWHHAFAIREKLAPRSLELAVSLNTLAVVAFRRGDLAGADELYKRSEELREVLAPGTLRLGTLLGNRAMVAQNRGDMARADELYRKGLGIVERAAPGSREEAFLLNGLGTLASDREDLAAAEAFYRRALKNFETLTPDGVEVAGCLHNLGNIAFKREDFQAAEGFYRRAMTLRERLVPGSLDMAASLQGLGGTATRLGRLDEAESLLTRSLALKRKLAPGSLVEANALLELGKLDEARRDLPGALRHYAATLAIREKLAPRRWPEAEARWAMARVERQMGDAAEATTAILEAVRVLDEQRPSLGGGGLARESFEAKFDDAYREAAELLVEQGRPEEAFDVVERSRARGLLALLAERDVMPAVEIPPERVKEEREVDAEYDKIAGRIERLSSERDAADLAELRSRLDALRDRRDAFIAELRRASPRLAALRYPEPLKLLDVRASLAPGTVLVSYCVGEAQTLLFVLGGSSDPKPAVFRIPLGRAALRERVTSLRGFIERGRAVAEPEGPLLGQAARLYDELLRPAEAELAPARRLLILPDGPLHALPFAALVRSREPLQYLVEWKPLHSSVSATVYAQLRQTPRKFASQPVSLAAFGDPELPQNAGAATEPDAGILTRARSLRPLPFSRSEVRGIASLFGRAATPYLGRDATEERADALGPGVRYVHFATHALLDRRYPLDSGLVLTPPPPGVTGRENGVLQAWEILQKVRLDADLVTLSACETGLGREMGGEGLISLSRAFEYAGARSVVASLWEIADRSTGELMLRFYRGLSEGLPKDEALQAAQVAMLHTPGSKHPFHWAAFELSGDWQ
jgi:CHAT domain-containing protein/Tfp pilus assembly protein PilF